MKYLVPVDISNHSSSALKYAIAMAHPEDIITVYHVHYKFNQDETIGSGYYPRMDTDNIREQIGILVDVCNPPQNGPEIEILIDKGEPVNKIVKKASNGNYDAIVMGTKDKYGVFENLFGTISTGVVRLADLPVYLIPGDQEYEGNRRILIATDEHLFVKEALDTLYENAEKEDTHMLFYHVSDLNNPRNDFDDYRFNQILSKVKKVKSTAEFQLEYHSDLITAILDKAKFANCDLIVISAEPSNWIENIFTNSVVKQLVKKGNKPMLFLPAYASVLEQN